MIMQAAYYPFMMTGSPSTYIKNEHDEFAFNPHQFPAQHGRFNMNQQYGQFTSNGGDMSSINPGDLTMGSMTNNYGQMSGSFMGNSGAGIDDDDLLALGNLDEQKQLQANGYGHVQQGQNFFPNGQGYTPDTNPIASPFLNQQGADFFNQYSNSSGQQFGGMQRRPMGSMDRHPSDTARSPMTPNQNMRIGSIGTPDSNHLQYQVPLNQHLNHHAKMQSASWNQNGNSGSAGSGWDSPLSSPINEHFHPGLAEVMHRPAASLPAKVENGMHTNYQTQEAKKKRRRESHNAVERRRRDNINERIHDLSRLVPAHRLEDEKVRKHLSNNGPLSPTLGATGMSPPAATSLLAGGAGRRAAGNITQGLPLEEKDKGPNKGDILNGAVSWTRDMMWQLYTSYKNEEKLRATMEAQGLQWPLTETEDQKRMKTELINAVEKNGVDNFEYSRGPGSGLRVPGHTTIDGSPVINGSNSANGQSSVSPSSANGQNIDWFNDPNHRASFSLKEEDESSFGMDMG